MSLYASCRCGIPEGSQQEHLRTDCPLYGLAEMSCPHCYGTGFVQKHSTNWTEGYIGTKVALCQCPRGQRRANMAIRADLTRSASQVSETPDSEHDAQGTLTRQRQDRNGLGPKDSGPVGAADALNELQRLGQGFDTGDPNA